MKLRKKELDVIRELLLERAAIILSEEQGYLVESRLASLVRETGCASVGALITRLEREAFGPLHQRVVEAMTTNETSFFRDSHPFETLKTKILPDLLLRRTKERRLRVWSAACSTGQEAYSLVMMMWDAFPLLKTWNVRVVGTDIASNVVDKARAGVFSPLEVKRGLPKQFLSRYLEPHPGGFRVRDEVRRVVEWKVMNLTQRDASMVSFDIIFLRNVLIYFDAQTRATVLTNAQRALRTDGYLFLGSTETPHGACTDIEPEVHGLTTCYRPKTAAQVAVTSGFLPASRKY